jgi:hypothetical protein
MECPMGAGLACGCGAATSPQDGGTVWQCVGTGYACQGP